MIWLVATLAVGQAVSPAIVIYFLLKHQRFLSEQNQTLTAALMATKNTPYAAHSAAIAEPDLEREISVADAKPVHSDHVIDGARLIGT